MNRPSNLELQVLSILWKHGSSTVREVLDELPDGRDRAYTTVLTVLQNMTSKKLARRESLGRAHAYSAAVSRKDALAPLVDEWVHYFFSGDVDELVALARSARKRPVKQRTETKPKTHTGSMATKKTTKKTAAPKKAAPKKAAPKPADKPKPNTTSNSSDNAGIQKLLNVTATDKWNGEWDTTRWMFKPEFEWLIKHDNADDIKKVMDHFHDAEGIGIGTKNKEKLNERIAELSGTSTEETDIPDGPYANEQEVEDELNDLPF